MKRIVMKFGGTSLGDGKRIKEVAKLVDENRAKQTAVVVSAMSGVTNRLIEIANSVAKGAPEREVRSFINGMRKKHLAAISEAASPEHRAAASGEIERLCAELEKVLVGVSYTGELTPRSLDFIVSFGERMIAPIVSGALGTRGINSRWFTGYDAGITTDSNFGKASPMWKLTNRRVKKILAPEMDAGIPVVTGFVAGDSRGRITTLGRGGSDYTAAILGAALDADEIWIWTDVDGVMTTDPKLVAEARIIRKLSYVEAMELAFFGAKVLHPKTIEPAIEKDIPVRVRNTFNPKNEGTLIVMREAKSRDIVKAVSIMSNVALLTISGAGMIGVPGVAARVFGALAREKVNILMISQGSSEVNISLVVDKSELKKAVRTIREEFEGKNVVKNIDYNDSVAVIAAVGSGMKGTRGVAARVFKAAADAGANVLMIAQGSSEVNISFVVSQKDAKKAAKALHDEFVR